MIDSTDNAKTSGAPLCGRSVVVTRTRAQSAQIADLLEALGAEVVACPVIEIVDPPDAGPIDTAIAHLAEYDWVVFTSTNAVRRFFAKLEGAGKSFGDLIGCKTAAVGTSTAAALGEFGVTPDFVPPEDFRAEALADEFVRRGAESGWRVLVPRALKAREVLPDALRALGATVDVAPVYMTVPATPCPETIERLARGGFDAVTFTSPSTVRNFLALLRHEGLDPEAVMGSVAAASIGPVTTKALNDAGFEAAVEAQPSTVPVLVERLGEYLAVR